MRVAILIHAQEIAYELSDSPDGFKQGLGSARIIDQLVSLLRSENDATAECAAVYLTHLCGARYGGSD